MTEILNIINYLTGFTDFENSTIKYRSNTNILWKESVGCSSCWNKTDKQLGMGMKETLLC
ncbi:MAG: hypothetical protein CMG80_04215 [Marinobacter sp.]|nr:hypothetical protein [Marinobacter sp.]